MKFGFIPIEGGYYYREFVSQVLRGEELGFDSIWLEEHHGIKDHYWPSPLVGLAGIVTLTKHIVIGTDIMVMPFYHPVRVAEDIAMLDVMSEGRFILGAAIGYKPDEFALYQAPMERRGARFEEALSLIKQLWTQEDVNFNGKYYQVQGLKIEPRPRTQPHPPIWIGGWGELSLTRAATIGDAWIPGPTADMDKLLEAQHFYHEKLRSNGIDPATRAMPLTREVVIAETDERAREVAEQHLMINYSQEYGTKDWKHPLIGGEDSTPVDQFEAISRNRFLVGSPETVINELKRYQNTFKVDHIICRLYFPGIPHDFIMQELEYIAEDVMPHFKS